MTDMHVKVSGAWKRVVQPHVRVSGVWKGVNKAYVRVSGTWKQFYAGIVTLTDYLDPNIIEDLGTGVGILEIRTDGTLWKDEGVGGTTQLNSGTDWVIPNGSADSSFDVKWVNLSGDAANDGNMLASEDTWFDLGTTRTIGYQDPSPPTSREGILRISIRHGGGAVIDTGDFEFSVIDTS